jgi:hypothetical protein
VSGDFYLKFPPHFWQMKTSKNTSLQIFKIFISIFGDISPSRKKAFWEYVLWTLSQSIGFPKKSFLRAMVWIRYHF